MIQPASIMPTTLTAGESLSVTFSNSDYSPDNGWALVYRFSGPVPFQVSGVDNDAGGFTVALTAAQTAVLPAGAVVFDALATKGADVVAVDRGRILIHASPLTVSQWQATLTAVESLIATWGTNDQRSVSMGDMSVSFRSLDELLNLRAFCIRQIARDTGRKLPQIIRSRFT
jgi:hypothetical protein